MQNDGLLQNKREQLNVRSILRRMAKTTSINIFHPLEIKAYITKLKSNGTKNKYEYIYSKFCEANQLPYDKTHYSYQPPIPLIPSTDDINIIMHAATERAYTPLLIMSEIAVEAEELHKTHRNQINEKEGAISIIGTKGHSNGTYKLKEITAENLRLYLAKHKNEHPFPASRYLGDSFRRYRKKQAKRLSKPELLKIPMKNLRNYAGAIFYLTKGKDQIQTMYFMRHKKLQTTMDYLRGIKEFTQQAKYITKTIKLGQPNTIEQITELSNSGFEKYNEADGYQFFRILQY